MWSDGLTAEEWQPLQAAATAMAISLNQLAETIQKMAVAMRPMLRDLRRVAKVLNRAARGRPRQGPQQMVRFFDKKGRPCWRPARR